MSSVSDILLAKSESPELWNSWHWQLDNSIITAKQFLSDFGIVGELATYYKAVLEKYPVRITPYYLALAEYDTEKKDPVLSQCFPAIEEIKKSSNDFKNDPFGEVEHMPVPGVIHRYKDRLVLLVSDICAVNCRHCTRKNILGDSIALYGNRELQNAFDYIKGAKDIREVLVSGGDPLMLETERLDYILGNIAAIEHVEVIRIGTRVPVVLPMRIDTELCEVLVKYRPLWVNTQFNHPVELTKDAAEGCDKLICAGIPVSNQSVLLKGINDDFDVMRELCVKLQRNMIRPYYVFQCDPVAGTSHFRTELSVGIEMEEHLRKSIGGLAMPRFVADLPDTAGKVPLYQV